MGNLTYIAFVFILNYIIIGLENRFLLKAFEVQGVRHPSLGNLGEPNLAR